MKRRGASRAIFLLATLPCFGAVESEFDQALAAYRNGEYSNARTLFYQLAQRSPDHPVIDFHLGRIALWFDDSDRALTHLRRALERRPDDASVHNALGDAYGLSAQRAPLLARLKWAARCLAAYERAVALEPENVAHRMSLLGYCLAAPRIAGGGRARAEAAAAEIARLDPAAGRIAWATLHLAERKPAQAFAQFDGALEQSPDDFCTLYQIGRCAALSGEELDRGETALRRGLQLPPPPAGADLPGLAHVHFRLGDILAWRGELPAASEHHAIARRLNPDLRADKIALKL